MQPITSPATAPPLNFMLLSSSFDEEAAEEVVGAADTVGANVGLKVIKNLRIDCLIEVEKQMKKKKDKKIILGTTEVKSNKNNNGGYKYLINTFGLV